MNLFPGVGVIPSSGSIVQDSPEYERARQHTFYRKQGLSDDQARAAIDDAEFEAQHGISRQQWLAARAAHAQQDREAELLAPIEGDPPFPTLPGVPRAESMFRNYCRWVSSVEADVARLERVLSGVEADVGSVETLKEQRASTLAKLAKSATAWLVGESQEGPPKAAELASLDEEIVVAAARAEISAAAQVQVEKRLADRRLQLRRLQERKQEFLRAALKERLDAEVAEGSKKLKSQLKAVSDYVRRVESLSRAAGFSRNFPDMGLNFALTGAETGAVEALVKSWEAPTTTN
jgi:hypothetical protein